MGQSRQDRKSNYIVRCNQDADGSAHADCLQREFDGATTMLRHCRADGNKAREMTRQVTNGRDEQLERRAGCRRCILNRALTVTHTILGVPHHYKHNTLL